MVLASYTQCSCSLASQLLPLRPPNPIDHSPSLFLSPSLRRLRPPKPVRRLTASKPNHSSIAAAKSSDKTKKAEKSKEDEFEEVEENLPWIQEKALDVVEFTGSVTQAIPGPRVGTSSLPWILALPLAYAGITFVIAFVKTVKKFTSPRAKRKRLVWYFVVFVCFGVISIWVFCFFGFKGG